MGEQLTGWIHVHHSHQWFWSAQTLERATHKLDGWSPILIQFDSNTRESNSHAKWMFTVPVSGSDLLTCWRATHKLNASSILSSVILIHSNTEEWLTRWMHVHPFSSVVLICKNTRETHSLDACSVILVSSSNLLIHARATHNLHVQPFLSVVLICSTPGEQLTSWILNLPH